MRELLLPVPGEALAQFCRCWKVSELALFGSALREDFASDSDVDMLVSFAENSERSLLDHIQMEQELAQLFGRRVDLVSKRALEQSSNWIRRNAILQSAQVLFSTKENHGA